MGFQWGKRFMSDQIVSTQEERLSKSQFQSGEGKIRDCYSLSSAKVDGMNILYIGIHGSSIKLMLSDQDADRVLDHLKEIRHVSSKPPQKRADRHQQR